MKTQHWHLDREREDGDKNADARGVQNYVPIFYRPLVVFSFSLFSQLY